ncbi:MAG: GNAT family N-acetyltransferase [Candidatus Magasanikbacteria bacterium]|jgi:[ribosomal protein S5]-alanine N-acetyltransferase|nr:GNAT family N-acetyltransferase [Candidatus Magasanikbacteria bacterium]MBT4071369.1 GNAT family N-acetyltransferase [Candidatus Magasanikbacteria bacterium]
MIIKRQKTTNLIIQTKNLLLQPITLDYAEEIFKEFTPEITTYMFPKSPDKIEETIEFIKTAIKKNETGIDFQVVILDKTTKEYLGNAGIHNINTKTPEFGIWIKKSAHGNAYGKEAMIAFKEWIDDNLDYDYILYPVDKANYASKRIPELLGGEIFREYDQKSMNNKDLHLLEYRIYPTKK